VLPEPFTGGWLRRSIRLGDGAPGEGSTVVWLQAGEHFADLRVPYDAPAAEGHVVMSFAGTTAWQPGGGDTPERLRWTHVLDLQAWAAEDGAAVWFDGDDLIEEGVFDIDGESVPYTEVWGRLPGSTGSSLVMTTADERGMVVRVGDHCLTVVDQRAGGGCFDADYRVLDGGRWRSQLSFGEGAARLPPPPEMAPVGSVVAIDGVEWRVVEACVPS